jgi:hypothetical protein
MKRASAVSVVAAQCLEAVSELNMETAHSGPVPSGTFGRILPEDLARVRRKIIHGYDNVPPMSCWRW